MFFHWCMHFFLFERNNTHFIIMCRWLFTRDTFLLMRCCNIVDWTIFVYWLNLYKLSTTVLVSTDQYFFVRRTFSFRIYIVCRYYCSMEQENNKNLPRVVISFFIQFSSQFYCLFFSYVFTIIWWFANVGPTKSKWYSVVHRLSHWNCDKISIITWTILVKSF